MAYSVQQPTQELGIRTALGALASHIRNMVVHEGMVLAMIAGVMGDDGALWLAHFLADLLFGVKAWAPAAFIATPLLQSAVALLAVWIPARRATGVNSMIALRFE
jgi:ABC-type antimicrobial peptide transport system permease subunit